MEIFAILQVLDFKWRLLLGMSGFLVGVLVGIFILYLFDSLNFLVHA